MKFIEVFMLLSSSFILLIIASYSIKHKSIAGAYSLFFLMIAFIVWSFGTFLEINSVTMENKIIWRNIQRRYKFI